MGGNDLVLRHVRAHGRVGDWIPGRIWLDQALRDVMDGLPGVAPEATLLVRSVRHMRAPPRRTTGPGSADLMCWRSALRAELSRLAREAGRPAHGAVAAAAPAVLFADAAELLTCLAQDWLHGALPDRWWWQMLGDTGDDPTQAVTKAWTGRPRHVPAALELLAQRGHHVAFAAGLPAAAVTELTRTVAQEWAAPWLARAAERAARLARPLPPAGDRENPAATIGPWHGAVPEVRETGLHPTIELLLGAGLMLSRTPAVAVAAPTAMAVRRWLAAREAPRPALSTGVSPKPTAERTSPEPTTAYPRATMPSRARSLPLVGEPPRSPSGRPVTVGETFAGRAPVQPPRSAPVAGLGTPSGNPAPLAAPASRLLRREPGLAPGATARGAAMQAADGRRGASEDVAARRAEVPASGAPDSIAPPPSPSAGLPIRAPAVEPPAALPGVPAGVRHVPAAGIADGIAETRALWDGETSVTHTISTQLGGIFYLLQPALIIGHYGDFSRPRESGLALSPWDWLALVATYLTPRASPRDPVWGLLARLAGRSAAEPPGRDFRPPRCWRVPPWWLQALPSPRRPWSWAVRDGRLVVRHPLGFAIIDVPVRGDPSRQLSAELQRYGPPAVVPAAHALAVKSRPLGARLTPSVARWREWTGEYVRAWLCYALGMPRRAAIGAFVMRRSAEVRATAERVDVTLALDNLPFEIRVAGLDLDPGWIPAAGRIVAFHYD